MYNIVKRNYTDDMLGSLGVGLAYNSLNYKVHISRSQLHHKKFIKDTKIKTQ